MDSKAITKYEWPWSTWHLDTHCTTCRNLTRDEKPRIERPESKKKQEQQQPSSESESDEEDYDYDDLENMDEVASIVLSSSDEEAGQDAMEEDAPSSISDIEDELENLEPTRPSKKRKHVESDDEEMDYELQPRKVGNEWTQKDYVERLPIKLPGGKIVKVDQDEKEQQEEPVDEMSQEEEEPVVEKQVPVEQEPAPKLTKKQYILAKKEELAQTATQIQEDPDENVSHWMHYLAQLLHWYDA